MGLNLHMSLWQIVILKKTLLVLNFKCNGLVATMIDNPNSNNYPDFSTNSPPKPWSFTHVTIILSFGMLNVGSDQVRESYVISRVKVSIMGAIHEISTSMIQLTLCYPNVGLIEVEGSKIYKGQFLPTNFQPTPQKPWYAQLHMLH